MTTSTPLTQDHYRHGAVRLRAGVPAEMVEAELVGQGLAYDVAARVVAELVVELEDRRRAQRRAGLPHMLGGAFFCAIGLALTAITYKIAIDRGGGEYLIAPGIFVFGAIEFFRGVEKSRGR
ncbi:MAG: hypothetical protein K8W52_41825 [Deltaproteobacteria bacterium]|nr:hypothetical protein [Deltaproteobacteria bacterium]